MRIRIGHIELQMSIFIFTVPLLLLISGCIREYAAAFVSIALHEAGHMAVAHFTGHKITVVRITPVGFSLSITDRDCSRINSIQIHLAGPVANLLLFVAGSLAVSEFPELNGALRLFSATNLYLALFNLLPVFPLDGGRVLLEVLAGSVGLLAAGRMIRRLAMILSVALLLTGAYQLYMSGFNFSLIIIGIYIFIVLKTGRMESALMNIRQIIYRRSRLVKKGIYPARDLVVMGNTLLAETLKCMDFDRFHIVYVLDGELRLMKVFTENEILNALVEDGENMTFEQLMQRKMTQTEDHL